MDKKDRNLIITIILCVGVVIAMAVELQGYLGYQQACGEAMSLYNSGEACGCCRVCELFEPDAIGSELPLQDLEIVEKTS